jgi:hypothetical protein
VIGADDEAMDAEADALPDEAAVLLRRAEALLAGDDLEADDCQSLAALLERFQEALANHEADDLTELLEALEDQLFDLDLE